MELKGIYKLSYTLSKEPKNLLLVIELKMIDGLMKPGQNVWEGIATLDGLPYTKEDLSHCVNARLAAERIGKQLKINLKTDAQKNGQTFRVKKEEVK